MSAPTRLLWMNHGTSQLVTRASQNQARRTFFASSTDHTRLLAEAEIHSWTMPRQQPQTSTIVYVLAASGMTTEMVQKVPQLHLARIYLDHANSENNADKKIIYGAKVVNRTLGNVQDVCGRLLSRALLDCNENASMNKNDHATAYAKSTLHGLSDHVLSGKSDVFTQLTETEQKVMYAIARGHGNKERNDASYNNDLLPPTIATAWHALAKEFVHSGSALEANLYVTHGATLESILDHEDISEFASTCGGTMALFGF